METVHNTKTVPKQGLKTSTIVELYAQDVDSAELLTQQSRTNSTGCGTRYPSLRPSTAPCQRKHRLSHSMPVAPPMPARQLQSPHRPFSAAAPSRSNTYASIRSTFNTLPGSTLSSQPCYPRPNTAQVNLAPSASVTLHALRTASTSSAVLPQQPSSSAFERAWHNRLANGSRPPAKPHHAMVGRHKPHPAGGTRIRPVSLSTSSSQIQEQLARLGLYNWQSLAAVHPARQDGAAPAASRPVQYNDNSRGSNGHIHSTNDYIISGPTSVTYQLPPGNYATEVSNEDQRMFDRWQAITNAAAQDEVLGIEDSLYEHAVWASSLAEGYQAADTSNPSGGTCAADIILSRAVLLLQQCTVQSIKKNTEPCCICLDDICVNELASLLMCGHRMHEKCLLKWLSQQLTSKPVEQQVLICPMCKQESLDRSLLSRV